MQLARSLIAVFTLVGVTTGCQTLTSSKESSKEDIIRYDFGRLSGPWKFSGFPLSGLDVKTVPWLDTPAMQYRHEETSPLRREIYRDSQWAAPPGALLERFLTRRIIFRQADPKGEGCHLTFLLHELEQTYRKQNESHVTLEVLALLLPSKDGKMLAKRAFYIQKSAPTPDANGSVAATRDAVQSLSANVDEWLSELANETSEIANHCRKS